MRMVKKIRLTCRIFFLVRITKKIREPRGATKYYERLVEKVHETLKEIPLIHLDTEKIEDYEKWNTGQVPAQVEDYEDFRIKYYKSRIIVSTSKWVDDCSFKKLFQQARDLWEKIEKVWQKYHEMLEKSNKDLIFFKYPLIEIEKNYFKYEYHQLEEEGLKTFFYEINDPYSGSFKPHDVLIRFSRPTIITTKVSDHSRNNLINAIYHSCLHPMRLKSEVESEKLKRIKPGYTCFQDTKDYSRAREFVENIFYKNQAAASQIVESHHILLLTAILGIAAIAGILAIIYVIPFFEVNLFTTSEEVKSFIGFILLILVFIMLLLFRPRGLTRKIFKRIRKFIE